MQNVKYNAFLVWETVLLRQARLSKYENIMKNTYTAIKQLCLYYTPIARLIAVYLNSFGCKGMLDILSVPVTAFIGQSVWWDS